MSAAALPDRDPAYGWVMVGAVFTISALAFGSLGAISVFLKPLSDTFGWSRADTALGYTMISLSAATFGILWGYIGDRYGTRWFGVISACTMSLVLVMLGMQESLAEFYLFYFIFGAMGCAMATTPLYANVGFWFRRNPGLALGVTASGGAVGQALVPYCAGFGISTVGWQQTYFYMALAYFLLAFPAGFLIRESPWRAATRGAPVPESRDFPLSDFEVLAWIGCAVIFCCNCMAVPIVHLVPLLTDAGNSLEYGARALMILMLAGGVGRVLGGRLGDQIGALPAYMIMSFGQTISVFWFPHVEGTAALYLLAVFFGFTYSGVMTSLLVCIRMMVSPHFAGRAMSINSFFGWCGMGLGGFFGGYLFDMTGGYTWSFGFAAAAGVINLVILTCFAMRILSAGGHLGRPMQTRPVPAT